MDSRPRTTVVDQEYVEYIPHDSVESNHEQGKCIQGKLSRDDGYSISVDAEDAPFSVSTFHLSTSRTTDVLINYELADGSHCRQVAFSSPDGVDVTNEQCGGAVSVQFVLPEESKFGECDLNIHAMDFDCSSGPKPAPTATPSFTTDPSTTTTPAHMDEPSTTTTPVHTDEPSTTVPMPTTHTHSISVMSPVTTPMTTSTIWTTEVFTVTQCPASVTDCPSHSTQVKTSTRSLSTTVCPAPTETTAITTSPVTTAPVETVKPAPCPEVVPKCMNTWLSIPKCDSNSDTACFCPSSEFADKVKSCIHAWSSTFEEEKSSLSYFAGICASYVPSNPAIVEMPTTSPALSVPMSTVAPTKAPVTSASMTTPCTTITWASHTVTVPQVAFSTITVSSSTSVCLIPGTTTPPPTTTSHHTTHTSMTTSCKSPTSTSTITVPMPTTPTPTTVLSNAGSKTFVSSMWAGMAMVVLGFL
jgi:hypothetical protein